MFLNTGTKISAFLAICLLHFISTAAGQAWGKRIKEYAPIEKTWWLQYNPLTLLEPELPIVATVSYKAGRQFSVGLDAGFFVAYNDYESNLHKYSGFRFKPEIKFYPAGERTGPRYFYIALQALVKHTIRPREDWLNKQDAAGQVLFSQLVSYKEKKMVYGLSSIFGSEFIFGTAQRFMLDIYSGLGFRTKKYHASGLPEGFRIDYNNNARGLVINVFQNATLPAISLGFKLGFRLN